MWGGSAQSVFVPEMRQTGTTSVGAPSSLAVQVAKEFNIILIGFLREDHFNIYHGREHIHG